jgi:cyclase
MKRVWRRYLVYPVVLGLLGVNSAAFSQDFEKVQIETVKVAPNLYMLSGAGGNIGVYTGENGTLLVDSQFSQLADKIKAAIAKIDGGPVRLLVNTHWHYDHVYGNEPFGKAGAVIIAHENTRRRMTAEQTFPEFNFKQLRAAPAALPMVTFADSLTLHFNGDDIEVRHIEKAHSDADVLVFFRKANVVHAGDLYMSTGYPFIDVTHGGSVDGVIAAAGEILGLADAETRVIPGHGSVSGRDGVEAFRDMLVTVRDRVARQIGEGKTVEEVVASKPTADLDKDWSHVLEPDMFVKIVYADLSKRQKTEAP